MELAYRMFERPPRILPVVRLESILKTTRCRSRHPSTSTSVTSFQPSIFKTTHKGARVTQGEGGLRRARIHRFHPTRISGPETAISGQAAPLSLI